VIQVYVTGLALVALAAFGYTVGRRNRDLLRARAYGEFLVRLVPPLTTAVFVLALPFVMDLTTVDNARIVLITYLAGAATLTILAARSVAPEERKAASAFRSDEPEKAALLYEDLISDRPLPRYYSSLGASRHAAGEDRTALEALDRAIELDPALGVAYYNRASIHAALGDKSRARGDLQQVFRVADSPRTVRRAAEEALKSLGS
jgi:tetratricopeptide (TPR) repeat protein